MGKMNGQLFLSLLVLAAARGSHSMDFDSVIRLFEPAGTITSPNYPDDYPNNALRVFVINPPGPEKVCLNFTDFRLYPIDLYYLDHVTLYDGCRTETGENIIGRYNKHDNPGTVCATSNLMTVVFKSNSEDTDAGFSATWTTAGKTKRRCHSNHDDEEPPEGDGSECKALEPCPPILLTGESGTVTSTNYPSVATSIYVVCVPSACMGTKLQFNSFDLENNLKYDSVTVYAGTLEDGYYGPFTGESLPEDFLFTGTVLTITLTSDLYFNFQGFNATYSGIACPTDT